MTAFLFCIDKIHLGILEAIYIAIDCPSLCRQLSSHIVNIFGEILETGVTYIFFFFHSVPSIQLISLFPFLIILSSELAWKVPDKRALTVLLF